MFGFVCACLCEWLLACNLTTAETKTSSLSFPHRQHKTAAGIAPRGQTKLNPSALLGSKGNWSCAVKWSESRWAVLRRGRVFGTTHTPTNILSWHALCPGLTTAMRGNLTHRTEYFTYPREFLCDFFLYVNLGKTHRQRLDRGGHWSHLLTACCFWCTPGSRGVVTCRTSAVNSTLPKDSRGWRNAFDAVLGSWGMRKCQVLKNLLLWQHARYSLREPPLFTSSC